MSEHVEYFSEKCALYTQILNPMKDLPASVALG